MLFIELVFKKKEHFDFITNYNLIFIVSIYRIENIFLERVFCWRQRIYTRQKVINWILHITRHSSERKRLLLIINHNQMGEKEMYIYIYS